MSYWWKQGYYWRSADKAAAESRGRSSARAAATSEIDALRQEVENYAGTVAALERRLDEVRGERDEARLALQARLNEQPLIHEMMTRLDEVRRDFDAVVTEKHALAERLARLSDHLFARHRHLAGLKVRGQLTTEGQSALHEIREALDVYESRLAAPRGDGR